VRIIEETEYTGTDQRLICAVEDAADCYAGTYGVFDPLPVKIGCETALAEEGESDEMG
jgi:hypothetical protein